MDENDSKEEVENTADGSVNETEGETPAQGSALAIAQELLPISLESEL